MNFRTLIEQKQEELVASLARCIQIPSVQKKDDSGYPYGKAVRDSLVYMLELAKALGFKTHNMDNHVGWCEYGTGEEMIAVLGHLDVVPEGDGWTVPPFGGEVIDGKIYGRGSMDDKGPTMAALYALLALKESGVPLKRRIRILFGQNEETGSSDMKYYVSHNGELPVMGFTPDGEYPVINGEKGLVGECFTCDFQQEGSLKLKELWGGTAPNIVPNLAWADFDCTPKLAKQIQAMQTEDISFTLTETGIRIEAAGISAHGGTPGDGKNAIGRLMQFLTRLPLTGQLAAAVHFLAEKIGMEYDGTSLGIAIFDEVSGPLTMNMGVIRGNETSLEVRLNYRYPVTKTFEDCGPIVKKQFEDAGFVQAALTHKESLYMPEDSTLVQKLLEVYTRCTGLPGNPKCIGGGTYAKMLPNVLAFGPIFPGDEVREHKADEFMEISRLIDNAEIIAEAMYALASD